MLIVIFNSFSLGLRPEAIKLQVNWEWDRARASVILIPDSPCDSWIDKDPNACIIYPDIYATSLSWVSRSDPQLIIPLMGLHPFV